METANILEDIETRKILAVHDAIHNHDQKKVTIEGKEYPVQISAQLLRYVEYAGVRYMEQNAYKNSKYATLAMQGHKITWGIRPGKWILIMDGVIKDA